MKVVMRNLGLKQANKLMGDVNERCHCNCSINTSISSNTVMDDKLYNLVNLIATSDNFSADLITVISGSNFLPSFNLLLPKSRIKIASFVLSTLSKLTGTKIANSIKDPLQIGALMHLAECLSGSVNALSIDGKTFNKFNMRVCIKLHITSKVVKFGYLSTSSKF